MKWAAGSVMTIPLQPLQIYHPSPLAALSEPCEHNKWLPNAVVCEFRAVSGSHPGVTVRSKSNRY